jgi:hypothetical protein
MTRTKVDWSKDDLKRFKKAFPTVENVRDLISDFGRSEGALRQKAHSIGLKRRTARGRALAASRKNVAKKTTRSRKQK